MKRARLHEQSDCCEPDRVILSLFCRTRLELVRHAIEVSCVPIHRSNFQTDNARCMDRGRTTPTDEQSHWALWEWSLHTSLRSPPGVSVASPSPVAAAIPSDTRN